MRTLPLTSSDLAHHLMIGVSLSRRNQCLDAFDKFVRVLQFNHKELPNILTPLYKHLISHSNNLHLRILISKLYILCHYYREAVYELNDIIDIDPNFSQPYFLLGKIYQKGKEKKSIFIIFEQTFQKGFFDSIILDTLPKMYHEFGHSEKCIGFFETLLRHKSDCDYYIKPLVLLYIQYGYFAKATTHLSDMATQDPDSHPLVISYCETILKSDPMHHDTRHLLASLLIPSLQPKRVVDELSFLFTHGNNDIHDSLFSTLKECLDRYPGEPLYVLCLATFHYKSKHYSESVHYLKLLYDTHRSFIGDHVISLLLSILKVYPEQSMALILLIDISLETNQTERVLNCLEMLIEQPSQEANYIYSCLDKVCELASSSEQRCQYLRARYNYNHQFFDTFSDDCSCLYGSDFDIHARLLMVRYYIQKESYSLAKNIFQSLLCRYPNNRNLHTALQEFHHSLLDREIQKRSDIDTASDIKVIFERGLLHLRKGNLYDALEQFQKITHDPNHSIKVHILISRCFLEMGRFDLSIKHLERLLPLLKDDLPLLHIVRYLLGVHFFNSGHIAEALAYFEQIIEENIRFPGAAHLANQCKELRFKPDQGKVLSGSYFDGSFTIFCVPHPYSFYSKPSYQALSFGYTHNNAGVDHVIQQNYKAAEEEFLQAIHIDPRFVVSYVNLGILYIITQSYDKAEDFLLRALQFYPKFDLIYINLSLLYAVQSKYDNAIEQLKHGLHFQPNNTVAFLLLGDIYFKLNDLKMAFHYWAKASSQLNLYYLIHRRVGYLNFSSFDVTHWINDFSTHYLTVFHQTTGDPRDQSPVYA